MKEENKITTYFVIGGLLILGGVNNFIKPNFGLALNGSSEALGYNVAIIGLPVLGIFLIYKAYKLRISFKKNTCSKSSEEL